MTTDRIRDSIDGVIEYLQEHPEEGRVIDTPATATLEEGLRFSVQGPDGFTVTTDMPEVVGGDGSHPNPGWLARAALASCDATVVAMRAAQQGIELSSLEVTVESESDDRGLLGVTDSVPPGPLSMRTRFRLAADDVPSERLEELVEWTEEHSPVGDAIGRAVENEIIVEVDG